LVDGVITARMLTIEYSGEIAQTVQAKPFRPSTASEDSSRSGEIACR
jgi:hypothetical protein